MHLSAWCYDLVSQISKKYMGQMFNQEGEAAISMYEDIEPDGAAIKAVKAALEAADLIREELTVKEEVGLGCYLVISVGPVSFSYDDREESQSIEGRSPGPGQGSGPIGYRGPPAGGNNPDRPSQGDPV